MRCGILGAGRSARRYRGGCARFSGRPARGPIRRACGFGVSDRLREARSVAPVLVHIHEPQVKAAKYTHLFQCVDPIFTREIRALKAVQPGTMRPKAVRPKRCGLEAGRPEAVRSERGGRGGPAEGCARRGGPQGKAGGARKGAPPGLPRRRSERPGAIRGLETGAPAAREGPGVFPAARADPRPARGRVGRAWPSPDSQGATGKGLWGISVR